MSRVPGGGIPLDQVAAMRQQQHAQRSQVILNLATNLFIQGKAESIDDAFILAEQFIIKFERRYGNEAPNQNSS